jgi:hypothetical protein
VLRLITAQWQADDRGGMQEHLARRKYTPAGCLAGVEKILASIRAPRSALFAPLALTAPRSISTGMSDLQSQMNAAMEEAQRADQKKREAAEALRARQHEYETASLRGRQQPIKRARSALEAARAAYEAAKGDVQRLDDKAAEVVQAQVRAAYM